MLGIGVALTHALLVPILDLTQQSPGGHGQGLLVCEPGSRLSEPMHIGWSMMLLSLRGRRLRSAAFSS